ncbi:MAG TPA: helix-turn-helix domain-containing protein [Candidatus Binatia bacterium]
MPREAIATPERILSAAFVRFSRYGFRRTSMEDIATEAGVSRAALYLQFRNKEEIFRRLAQQMQDEALSRAAAALAQDAPLADRIVAAILAKGLRFVEISLASPHASELLDETNRLCGDLIGETERRFLDQLARVLRRAAQAGEIDLGETGLAAGDVAQLLLRAVKGLKGPGVTVEDYRKNVDSLVRVFVAGLRPRVAARPAARSTRTRQRAAASR